MARRRRTSSASARRKFLINARESVETRVAILNGNALEDHALERESLGSILGNIYKARITNVEKSIGAAFVDFGGQRQGFLHVSDLSAAAVGADVRGLLANVQAARESAHDEDLVPDDKPEPVRARGAAAPAAEDAAPALPAARDAQAEAEDGGWRPIAVRTLDAAPVARAPEHGALPAEVADVDLLDDLDDLDEVEDDEEDQDDEDEPEDERILVHASLEEEDADDDVELVNSPEELEVPALDEDDDEDDDLGDERVPLETPSAAPVTPGADGTAAAADAGVAAPEEQDEDAEDEEAGARPGRRRRGRRGRGRRRGKGAPAAAEKPAGDATDDDDDEDATEAGDKGGGRRRRRREGRELPEIEQILRRGDEIVVQVIKDGIGTKGPTMTSFLAIPGRYVVLMPGIAKRGVSRKIIDNGERDRLKALVRRIEVPEGLGFVVRTAGVGKSEEDLQKDLAYLLRLWKQLQVRVREHGAPVLLYQENDLVIRTLRDYYDGQGDIIVDDRKTAEQVRGFMATIMPECVEKVQLYEGEKPLFTAYGLEKELEKLLNSRIELKSGGTLVIEQTEALVAIDVNSGRARFEGGIDETAFQVNAEAAVEIARQIRLRDLGGVVVVDFIDMRTEKKRKQLEALFREELRKDRARIKMARFSPFGIIELTRQRVRPSLKRSVHERCPYCAGTGYIPSDETSCLSVVRRVREHLARPGAALIVTVRPEVAEAVLNEQREALSALEAESHKRIYVRSDHRLSYEDVEVRPMLTLPTIDHRRA